MEQFFKIVFKGVNGDGISAIPPKLYQTCFHLKMTDIRTKIRKSDRGNTTE
ncbi:hypothetical protein V7S43_010312 [Phytophthora oleae]|uniref:HECT domain-containing protein n=1 Tax=Phytophthora oleae TaxID=2107226 RepID=A0ABD3FE20_9STRA